MIPKIVKLNGRFDDQKGIAKRGPITGHNCRGIPCRQYTWVRPYKKDLKGKTFEARDTQVEAWRDKLAGKQITNKHLIRELKKILIYLRGTEEDRCSLWQLWDCPGSRQPRDEATCIHCNHIHDIKELIKHYKEQTRG